MRYTVTWLPGAQNRLADIWNQASNKQEVADAANRIDRLLGRSPLIVGEEYGNFRKLSVEPLEVVYRVSTDDCLVEVISVVFFG